jgi:hypothetical protein
LLAFSWLSKNTAFRQNEGGKPLSLSHGRTHFLLFCALSMAHAFTFKSIIKMT